MMLRMVLVMKVMATKKVKTSVVVMIGRMAVMVGVRQLGVCENRGP